MRTQLKRLFLIALSSFLLIACSLPSFSALDSNQTKFAEIIFEVEIPSATSPGEIIYIEIFEPLSNNTTRNLMNLKDTLHSTYSINLPTGQMIMYRYLRGEAADVVEADTSGNLISYRNIYIEAPSFIQDIVSAWSNHGYTGMTGQIQGSLTSELPLQNFFASAAGITVPVNEQGNFEINGLRPGTHWLVIYNAENLIKPFQQQAIIAPNAITPVIITLNQ